MKKIVCIISVLLCATCVRAQGCLNVSAGLNSHAVFTVGAGVGFLVYQHAYVEGNMIVSGFHGQSEPALFGARAGYKIWMFTPFVGRYYGLVSTDKKELNKWSTAYGIRAEKDVVFVEYSNCGESYFLIGLKIRL